MAFWHVLFGASILLSLDGLLELAFVSSLVAYVQRDHGNATISIGSPPDQFTMYANPNYWLLDAGHVANAGAGSSFFLGIAGALVAFLIVRPRERNTPSSLPHSDLLQSLFTLWSVLVALLTLAAIIMLNVVNNSAVHQISYSVARGAGLNYWYPDYMWTPGNWYSQLLTLPITHQRDIDSIKFHLKVFAAGQWNLVALFILDVAYSTLAVYAWRRQRRHNVRHSAARPFAVGKPSMSSNEEAESP